MEPQREFWALVESVEPGISQVSLIEKPEDMPPVLLVGWEDWAKVWVIPCPVTLLTVPSHTIVAVAWEVVESYMSSQN